MRTEIKDRYYRVFTYQSVDRVPDIEFGYWPQTIRRWLKEGLPLELTPEETQQMFLRKLDDFFGFEHEGHGVPCRQGINPPFEEQVLERKEKSIARMPAMALLTVSWYSPSGVESATTPPPDWT